MSKDYYLYYKGKKDESFIIEDTKRVSLQEVKSFGESDNWTNMLIFGDNLLVLKSLMDRFRGKVNLIYIDPPFSTEREFKDLDKNHAYHDKLNGSAFIEFLRKRLILLKEFLSDDGSIYVHIDQKKGHYIKVIMDEIFGEENFINDITRIKCNPKGFERKGYGNVKDVIYFYSKNIKNNIWTDFRKPLTQIETKRLFPKVDKDGRRYATTPLHAPGETANGVTGQEWKGMKPPKGRHWRYPPIELTKLDESGLLEWSKTGNPRKKIFADESLGVKMQDVWEFKDPGVQRQDYPTEKNQDMLDFIIQNSSRDKDLVLDCFCGSGTTLISAEKFNRKWIGIDNSQMAIKVSKDRLSKIKNHNPFTFYNATNQELIINSE